MSVSQSMPELEPELEVVIQHDWEDGEEKGVSAEILLVALNLLKAAAYHTQRGHIEKLRQIFPDEFHSELDQYDFDNPAYRIVFVSVEHGSVKARGRIAAGLLSLSILTGAQLASDTIKDTIPYTEGKAAVVQMIDNTYDDFKKHLHEQADILNKDESNKFTVSVEEKEREKERRNVLVELRRKVGITNEPSLYSLDKLKSE